MLHTQVSAVTAKRLVPLPPERAASSTATTKPEAAAQTVIRSIILSFIPYKLLTHVQHCLALEVKALPSFMRAGGETDSGQLAAE